MHSPAQRVAGTIFRCGPAWRQVASTPASPGVHAAVCGWVGGAGKVNCCSARSCHTVGAAAHRNPAETKNEGGTIADLFTSLGADAAEMEPRFGDIKKAIAANPAALQEAFDRVSEAVARRAEAIQGLAPEDVVPVVPFSDIDAAGGFTEEVADRVRDVGVVVVRGTIPEQEAVEWIDATRKYLKANPGHTGFPEDNIQVYEIYWAKAQLQARQHRNMAKLGLALNGLWHTSDGSPSPAFDTATPLTYVDRMRMRVPGDTSFALGTHMDGGGIERWEDPSYRQVYRHIFSGQWELHDPFSLDHRDEAVNDLYETPNACSVFRTFQGWTALSHTAPGEGTLRVVPFLREATAYMLLRAFAADVPEREFPGAAPRTTQDVNAKWHGPLVDAAVSIPQVHPGDTVWWHCDAIHAVESVHGGTEDSSVFYIPQVPLSRANARYLATQRDHFLASKTPPDFPANHSEVGFVDRGTVADLAETGKRAMGLVPFETPADASDELKALHADCNRILGF